MNNNDFITKNFGTGNNTTGNTPLNIQIRGTQVADTEGRYLSRLTAVKAYSNRPEDSEKVLFQYELIDEVGTVYLFREAFTCNPFNDRWNDFGNYVISNHDVDGEKDISELIGLKEILMLDWQNGFLNIICREKAPDDFNYKMLKSSEAVEQ